MGVCVLAGVGATVGVGVGTMVGDGVVGGSVGAGPKFKIIVEVDPSVNVKTTVIIEFAIPLLKPILVKGMAGELERIVVFAISIRSPEFADPDQTVFPLIIRSVKLPAGFPPVQETVILSMVKLAVPVFSNVIFSNLLYPFPRDALVMSASNVLDWLNWPLNSAEEVPND